VTGTFEPQGLGGQLSALTSSSLPCPSPTAADEVLSAVFQPGRIEASVTGARLTIGRAGAGRLEYAWVPADAAATDPAKLTDRPWYLTAVAGDPVGERVVLNIHADGTVTGYDGCRELDAARAQVGAGTLTVTGLPAGGSANCASDLAATVADFLGQRPALWHLADGKLVVNSPGNAQGYALVFGPTDPGAAPADPAELTGTPWQLAGIKDADGTDVRPPATAPSRSRRTGTSPATPRATR
jgi:hypothetical protein